MTTGRYAILKPELTPVLIKFSTVKPLMAGGDFRIYNKERKDLLENWKMTVVDAQEETHILRTSVNNLNMAVFAWQVLVCSKDPAIYTGRINIDVFQGGVPVKFSLPIESEFEEITPCKLRKPLATDGTLTFIVKT